MDWFGVDARIERFCRALGVAMPAVATGPPIPARAAAEPRIPPKIDRHAAPERAGVTCGPPNPAERPPRSPAREISPETVPAPPESRIAPGTDTIEEMLTDELKRMASQSLRRLTEAERAPILAARAEATRRDPAFKVRDRRRRRKRPTSSGDAPALER